MNGWKTFSFPKGSIVVKHSVCEIPDATFEFDKGVSNIISTTPCIAVEVLTISIYELNNDESVVWLFTIWVVFKSLLNNIDKSVL